MQVTIYVASYIHITTLLASYIVVTSISDVIISLIIEGMHIAIYNSSLTVATS